MNSILSLLFPAKKPLSLNERLNKRLEELGTRIFVVEVTPEQMAEIISTKYEPKAKPIPCPHIVAAIKHVTKRIRKTRAQGSRAFKRSQKSRANKKRNRGD